MLKRARRWILPVIFGSILMGCSKSSESDGGVTEEKAAADAGAVEVEQVTELTEDVDENLPPATPITIVDRDLAQLSDQLTAQFTAEELEALNSQLTGLWLMISEGTSTKTWTSLNGTGSSTKTFTSYRLFSIDTEHPDAILFTDEEIAALPATAYFNMCTHAQGRFIYTDEMAAEEPPVVGACDAVEEEEAVEEEDIELPAVTTDFLPVYPFLLNAGEDQFTIPANHPIFGLRNTGPVQVQIESNSRMNFGQVRSEWDKASLTGTCEENVSTMDTIAIKFRNEMERPVGTLSIDNVVTLINCLDYSDGTFQGEAIEAGEVETAEGTYTNMGLLNVTDSFRGLGMEAYFIEDQLFYDLVISNNGFLHFDDGDEAAQYFIFENGPANFSAEIQSVHPETKRRLLINYILNL